ncbi:hypothetical protein DAI22_02g214801 [Oryza sativa Japonica Group]|nr:hypothetical protein DAI22_02g214801 [Oryza sativa Japonica Group]
MARMSCGGTERSWIHGVGGQVEEGFCPEPPRRCHRLRAATLAADVRPPEQHRDLFCTSFNN